MSTSMMVLIDWEGVNRAVLQMSGQDVILTNGKKPPKRDAIALAEAIAAYAETLPPDDVVTTEEPKEG